MGTYDSLSCTMCSILNAAAYIIANTCPFDNKKQTFDVPGMGWKHLTMANTTICNKTHLKSGLYAIFPTS